VGVGLVISWVTGAIAYYVSGNAVLLEMVELEFIVSVGAFVVAYVTRKGK
jgi:hypothetical protein